VVATTQYSKRADLVGIVICVRGLSRYMKREFFGRFGNRKLEYVIIGKFLTDLKKEFGEEDNKIMKVAELKKIEQGSKIIDDFVQKFKKVAGESGYKERLLIENSGMSR